jgi:hypothetical protein
MTGALTLQGPLAEKEEKQQCGYFLLCIGKKGRDIYTTGALKSAEKDKIEALFDKFEAYCNPKQNVTVLYATCLEEMIRDWIVCGTNNPRIKEKLLQAETLDLSRAINIAMGVEISTHISIKRPLRVKRRGSVRNE